jgi:hypothetical protein
MAVLRDLQEWDRTRERQQSAATLNGDADISLHFDTASVRNYLTLGTEKRRAISRSTPAGSCYEAGCRFRRMTSHQPGVHAEHPDHALGGGIAVGVGQDVGVGAVTRSRAPTGPPFRR